MDAINQLGQRLSEQLQNPRAIAIKQFMIKMLGNKYPEFDDLVTRITHHLVTEGDLNSFASMMNKIYELGYQKAINDYKSELAKMNIDVKYKPETK